MTRAIRTLMLCLALFASTGCFQTHLVYGRGGDPERPPVHTEWRHHFLIGLLTTGDPISVRALCPSGNATVITYLGILNGLLLLIPILNLIWETTSVAVYCGAGATQGAGASIELGREEARAIVLSPEFREAVARDMPERLPELDRQIARLEAEAR